MFRLSLLLFFPILPGCLAYGYPSMTYTPALASLDPDVRVFKSTSTTGGMSVVMTGGEQFGGGIEELPVKTGHLDAQRQTYFAYFAGGIPISWFDFRSWKLFLYRPGYEVIELSSRWQGRELLEPRLDKLPWKPAPDLASQIQAIEKICPEQLFAGPSSEVCGFAASEYERLAASPLVAAAPCERDRLLEKAKKIRQGR